jgi:hypothetical protein
MNVRSRLTREIATDRFVSLICGLEPIEKVATVLQIRGNEASQLRVDAGTVNQCPIW